MHEMRLKCGLFTLQTIRLTDDHIQMFKIVNGYENTEIFFPS